MAMMPFTAILWHDLRTLWKSWLVRLWLVATFLLAGIQLLSNWDQLPRAPLIAALLFPYLVFPWSLMVMVLSVNPLSGSQSGAAADAVTVTIEGGGPVTVGTSAARKIRRCWSGWGPACSRPVSFRCQPGLREKSRSVSAKCAGRPTD